MDELNLSRPQWRKSSYSSGNGQCVEACGLPDGGRAVRDSKDQEGPALIFRAAEWAAFVAGIKAGEFG